MKNALKWVSFIIALVLAWLYVDVREAFIILFGINPFVVFFTVFLLVLGGFISGARWFIFCKGVGIPSIDFWRKIRVNYAASVTGYFLPVSGASDLFRAMSVSLVRTDYGWASIASIGASRANGFAVSSFSLVVSALFLDIPETWKYFSFIVMFICFIMMFFGPIILHKFNSLRSIPLMSKSFKKAWLLALFYSLAFQLLLVTSRAFLGWNMGVELGWIDFLFISSALFIASPFLPSIGFVGFGTVGFVGFASTMGADVQSATALSIAWYGCWVIASLPGLLFFKSINGKDVLSSMKIKLSRKLVGVR